MQAQGRPVPVHHARLVRLLRCCRCFESAQLCCALTFRTQENAFCAPVNSIDNSFSYQPIPPRSNR